MLTPDEAQCLDVQLGAGWRHMKEEVRSMFCGVVPAMNSRLFYLGIAI